MPDNGQPLDERQKEAREGSELASGALRRGVPGGFLHLEELLTGRGCDTHRRPRES